MDITDLILNDHHEQRRMFAYLDDIDDANTEALSVIWQRLKILLEVHAAAEEQFFYPHLLNIGTGAGGEESAASETKDVIKEGLSTTPRHRRVVRHFRSDPSRGIEAEDKDRDDYVRDQT